MNTYEMTYIVRPDLDEDETRATVEGVTGRLEAANAEVIATVPWNPPRRRMAYTIRDYGDGFYVTTVFRLDPQAVRPFENGLKLNERVLRFLLVQATDLNIQQATQRLQQQQQAAAPRPQPAPEGAPAPALDAEGSAAPTVAGTPDAAVPVEAPIPTLVEAASPEVLEVAVPHETASAVADEEPVPEVVLEEPAPEAVLVVPEPAATEE